MFYVRCLLLSSLCCVVVCPAVNGQAVDSSFEVTFRELSPEFGTMPVPAGDPDGWASYLAEGLSELQGLEPSYVMSQQEHMSLDGDGIDLILFADFDKDCDVDGIDFLIWQSNFVTPSGATLNDGDADGDGDVDGEDFLVWQREFGSVIVKVPEPTALTMFGFVAVATLAVSRRRSVET